MPAEEQVQRLGTRFLVFAQAPYVPGYERPEIVWISTPPGRMRPGPADDRMYVVDPALPKPPYEFPFLPPYPGAIHPPVEPAQDGHFDHLEPGTRAFVAAHSFAVLRRVLDIWESYLGHDVAWHFAPRYERLEIIPLLDWDNAQSGYGYMEFGLDRAPNGRASPFALNFDVMAHEVGHNILFAELGLPSRSIAARDYGAYHEAVADLISLISFLHFDTALDRLLRSTQGNLMTLNELNRIAEMSDERQIRIASSPRKLSEVSAEVHDRSRPFTGAVFDSLVEVYHALLVERGLLDPVLGRIDLQEAYAEDIETIGHACADAFGRHPLAFKAALGDARDLVGETLARSWTRLDPDALTFAAAASTLLEAVETIPAAAPHRDIIVGNFRWRELLETEAAAIGWTRRAWPVEARRGKKG